MNNIRLKFLAGAAGALAVSFPIWSLNAQELPQLDQAQQVQRVRELQGPAQPATSMEPSFYPGEEEDTGKQVIAMPAQPHWNWINFSIDAQYFYSSNAFLSGTAIRSTALFVTTVNGEIDAPPVRVPNGLLYAKLGYQYQRYFYGIGDAHNNTRRLDFDLHTVYAEAQYELPDQWCLSGEVDYNRLLDHGALDEFYKEVVPTFRIQKTFTIRSDLATAIEYSGNYRASDETGVPHLAREAQNRTDQALDFTLIWHVAPKVDLRPFYRFQYSYYPSFYDGRSRNDFLHTLGISADYFFNSWSSVRLFLTYELRDSDAATIPDYRKFDGGGGVSLALSF